MLHAGSKIVLSAQSINPRSGYRAVVPEPAAQLWPNSGPGGLEVQDGGVPLACGQLQRSRGGLGPKDGHLYQHFQVFILKCKYASSRIVFCIFKGIC
jgi:hypothetical protein